MAITVKPVAFEIEESTTIGSAVNIPLGDLFDLSHTEVVIAFVPTDGTLDTADGSELIYSPNPGFEGTEVIKYSLCTLSEPVLCDESTIIIGVEANAEPQEPSAVNDEVSILQDSGTTIVSVLDNDNSMGAELIVSDVLYDANHGSCALYNDGEALSYTPVTGYSGQDNCVYQACNDAGLCDSAVLTITIDPAGLISMDGLNDFDQNVSESEDHSNQSHLAPTKMTMGFGAVLGSAVAIAGVIVFMRERSKSDGSGQWLIKSVDSGDSTEASSLTSEQLPDMLTPRYNATRDIETAGSNNLSVTAFLSGEAGSPENRNKSKRGFFSPSQGSPAPKMAPVSPANSLFSMASSMSSRSKKDAVIDDIVDL